MANILKSTLIYTIGNIIPKAAHFILLPIYTLYLTPSDYGIIEAVNAISPILVILFSFSFGASIFRLYYDYEEKQLFFGTIFSSTFFLSTFFLICFILFRDYIEQIYSSIPFYPYFFYVIIASYISNLFDLPQKYLMIQNKPISYISLSLLRFAINAGLILWFIINKDEGASGYLKAGVFSAAIVLPIYLLITSKIITFKFSFKILKNVLLFSLPLIPTLLSAWVLDLSDRIFLENYFTLTEVGIYSLAYKIASLVLLIVTSFGMAYRPLFFKFANMKEKEKGKKMIFKYNYLFLMIFIVLGFSVSLLSKEMIIILFAKEYSSVYIYIPLIIVSYLFSFGGGLVARFFEQSKRMVINMYIFLGISAINLLLNFLLIPPYGAYGAAISTIISLLIGFVIGYDYAKKHCYFVPFNWKGIWPVITITVVAFGLFNFILTFENIYYSLGLKLIITFLLISIVMKLHFKDFKILVKQ